MQRQKELKRVRLMGRMWRCAIARKLCDSAGSAYYVRYDVRQDKFCAMHRRTDAIVRVKNNVWCAQADKLGVKRNGPFRNAQISKTQLAYLAIHMHAAASAHFELEAACLGVKVQRRVPTRNGRALAKLNVNSLPSKQSSPASKNK